MQQPKPILFTREGYEKILQEQKQLLSERPAAVEDLKKAREMGDLSENGYYKSARAKLSSIDARLRHVVHMVRYGKVEEAAYTGQVHIGTKVTLQTENGEVTYMVVGEHEANPSEKKISHLSPLGSKLLTKKVGEKVHIQTPKGEVTYSIKNVS